jgi:adenylate cyclase
LVTALSRSWPQDNKAIGVSDVKSNSAAPFVKRTLIGLRQIGWLRTLLTLFALSVAVLIARNSWNLPLFLDAETALFDARQVATAPTVTQDDRIVLIPYTDQTLINTGKRSPLDRAILAKALKRIDAMGAKAIGIDVLIDQKQPEDSEIIAAFQAMRTPTYLAYANSAAARDKILFEQQEFLDDFQSRIATANVKPASIIMHADQDNVLRLWGKIIPGDPPRIPNAMIPEAKAFAGYLGSVVYLKPATEEQPIFASIPIDTFADDELFSGPNAGLFTQQIAGKYVLIGGNILDIDTFETPLSRSRGADETKSTWGMEIFAHMLAQILDNRLLKPIADSTLWGAALFIVMVGGLSAASSFSPFFTGTLVIAQLAMLLGIPFVLAARGFDTYGLPAFGWTVSWLFAFATISAAARALGSEQRKFAQSALGKYLPRDIAAEILKDPDSLRLRGEKREIFVVFTDLEGFTKLSHAIEPEMVATLLNRYLESLSNVVLDHGGTIDKFVGDAVVAFWGAPISRPDDGERAVKAAMAMYQAGEDFRKSVPEGVPAIGRTRVGLHHGDAIIGNFGGEGRIQYTALGDSMNTASRLESANKQMGSNILVSEEAAELSGLDIFRPLGRIVLRGRATPISVFEPVPHWTDDERKTFSDLINRVYCGDVSALTMLGERSYIDPSDQALTKLVHRLNNQEKGGYFVLD